MAVWAHARNPKQNLTMKCAGFSAIRLLPMFRLSTFCLSFVLAVTAMDLSCHVTSFTVSFDGRAVLPALLAIVAAGLTILTLPIMLIVDSLYERAFTSTVLVELVWLGSLWILWLTTGVDGADSINTSFPGGCHGYENIARTLSCRDLLGIIVLSFLNFALLFVYSMSLIIFATLNNNRGRSVWTSSVKLATSVAQTNLSTPSNINAVASPNTLAYGGGDFLSRIPSCS